MKAFEHLYAWQGMRGGLYFLYEPRKYDHDHYVPVIFIMRDPCPERPPGLWVRILTSAGIRDIVYDESLFHP